jgi:hypothetical protein
MTILWWNAGCCGQTKDSASLAASAGTSAWRQVENVDARVVCNSGKPQLQRTDAQPVF